MSDLGFEPDRTNSWLFGPVDDPALDRTADVVLGAMAEAGSVDPHLAIAVLIKVQAMIVARVLMDADKADVENILTRVGPAVREEAGRFLQALRHDMRKAS